MIAGRKFRGKSGLHEVRVPGNARRGQPQGKRHREESALVSGASSAATKVMVKRWGKSPPRTGQPGRYGKPHPEQCRIGALCGKVRSSIAQAMPETSAGTLQPLGPGWQLDRPGNRCGRGMVIQRRKPWTESGLQAIRAFFLLQWPDAVDSAAPMGKRRASRICEGLSPLMQERRLWPNRRRSRSV